MAVGGVGGAASFRWDIAPQQLNRNNPNGVKPEDSYRGFSPRKFDVLEINGFYSRPQNKSFPSGSVGVPQRPGIGGAGALDKTSEVECRTCASRRYQDVSNDSSVSFQSPTKLNPHTAASAVMSHEQEHVVHEQAYAERSSASRFH